MDDFEKNLEAYALLFDASIPDLKNVITDYNLKIKCPDMFTLTDLRHIINMLNVSLEELCSGRSKKVGTKMGIFENNILCKS